MTNIQQWAGLGNSNAQLFQQLPPQPVAAGLAFLNLATGKLPQPTLMCMVRAFGNQNTVLRVADDGGDDMDTAHGILGFVVEGKTTAWGSLQKTDPAPAHRRGSHAPRPPRRPDRSGGSGGSRTGGPESFRPR